MRLIIVQKFGGTSVSTPERRQRVVDKIVKAKRDGFCPVVVVSAPGRMGEPYATDTLIDFAQRECFDISKRELDMIMTCGEIVAGVIVVGTLKQRGLDAVFLSGQQAGIITTSSHGNAQIMHINNANILNHVNQGRIVVVAGFQGVSEEGEITTLGRGGSDTTGAALGAALGACSVEIYTDVDGVMTADPRIVPAAETIRSISYDDLYNLAIHGAKVIHPRAVEIARRHNIKLKIKSTFTEDKGTAVSYDPDGMIETLREQSILGVACRTGCSILKISSESILQYPGIEGFFREVAATCADPDFLNVSTSGIDLLADKSTVDGIVKLAGEAGLESAEVISDCIKVSAVGHLAGSPASLVSRMVEILRDKGIDALRIYSSPIAVSIIIKQEDMQQAVHALHDSFITSGKEGQI